MLLLILQCPRRLSLSWCSPPHPAAPLPSSRRWARGQICKCARLTAVYTTGWGCKSHPVQQFRPQGQVLSALSRHDRADSIKPVSELLCRCSSTHDSFQLGQWQVGQACQAVCGVHQGAEVGLCHAWQPPQHVHCSCVHHGLSLWVQRDACRQRTAAFWLLWQGPVMQLP